MLENSASSEDAIMISQDTAFPNYSESVNLSRFPAAYYFDFDNDTKKDLIVAPNGNNVSHNFENIWFYKMLCQIETYITLSTIQLYYCKRTLTACQHTEHYHQHSDNQPTNNKNNNNKSIVI